MCSLRRFIGLPWASQALLLQAIAWLAFARLMLTATSFRRLSERMSAPAGRASTDFDPDLIKRVGWAVQSAARRVPWRADCFPQAIAGRKLLERRGLGSTIHIGVVREPSGGLAGHAWLTCGDLVVTGGGGLGQYAVLHRLSGEDAAA